MTEIEIANRLEAAFDAADDWDVVARRRFGVRLRSIEPDADREVHQFRALQQAVRESAGLATALESAGFADLENRDTRHVEAETGLLIQGS